MQRIVRICVEALSIDGHVAAQLKIDEALKGINSDGSIKAVARIADIDDLRSNRPRLDHKPAELSDQEWRIANLVAQSLKNRSIAEELGVTEATVKQHLKAILHRLKLPNRTALALWVISQQQKQKQEGDQ